jgi:hypothetical protein
MDDLNRNNGFATREQITALGRLDFLEVSQAEFKDMTDARNGFLGLAGLGRLATAAKRQSDARNAQVEAYAAQPNAKPGAPE